MGHVDEVREFIRWYAPYQRADGFVPCCVDVKGADWLVEHDSHGQLIALIADYYPLQRGPCAPRGVWTYVDTGGRMHRGSAGADGLLPISVSHEGYLAQPVHSYWDDFWALRGLRDAVELAQRSTGKERRRALAGACDAIRRGAVRLDRERPARTRDLDFIPGSIEWADFDPTATANAIALLDMLDELDRDAVERTFDRYLSDWRRKRSGALDWQNYTPYEIRIIGAFVRLGRRDAALELLRFFLADRRPPPGISGRRSHGAIRARRPTSAICRTPGLPPNTCSRVRSLFAYEREADRMRSCSRRGLRPNGSRAPACGSTRMPTLYGSSAIHCAGSMRTPCDSRLPEGSLPSSYCVRR